MLMDGYNSIVRYYMNNFTDGFRQDAMHLFLGQYLVHEADGTPKPLTGPGGRGRRGSGNADTEWRTQFLPLVFTFAMAMSVLCVIVPTGMFVHICPISSQSLDLISLFEQLSVISNTVNFTE